MNSKCEASDELIPEENQEFFIPFLLNKVAKPVGTAAKFVKESFHPIVQPIVQGGKIFYDNVIQNIDTVGPAVGIGALAGVGGY